MNLNPITDPATEPWHTTFVGQHMQHNYRLYFVLDEVFNTQPQIERCVEIGTGCGALTTFLCLWAIRRKLKTTYSFDVKTLCDTGFLFSIGAILFNGDVFDSNFEDGLFKEFFYKESVIFICDGGDKQREFDTFAPKLKSGSIICAHDLGTEFFDEKISSEVRMRVEPIMQDRWMECNVRFAIYKVK